MAQICIFHAYCYYVLLMLLVSIVSPSRSSSTQLPVRRQNTDNECNHRHFSRFHISAVVVAVVVVAASAVAAAVVAADLVLLLLVLLLLL